MNCKKAETFLVEYLYQELSPTKIVELEKHLEVCDGCTRTLESWRGIHEGYRKSSHEEPLSAPYLRQRVMIAAKEELERKPTFTERLLVFARPALILPVLVFAVLSILFYPRKATKIAQVPAQPAVAVEKTAPLSVSEPQDYRQKQDEGRAIGGYAGEMTDKLNSRNREEAAGKRLQDSEADSPERRLNADELAKSKDAEYNEGLKAGTPASQPPPPSAPVPSVQQESSEAKKEQEKKPGSLIASANMPVSAETYVKESQDMLVKNDLQGSVKAAQQAYGYDSKKSLASEFHQNGIQLQQNKECAKAILPFNFVAKNYRDYSSMDDVLLRLGDCYAEIGEMENARKTYQQLLSSKSYKPVAQQKLQELDNKVKTQEQLKALGYVSDKQ